MGVGVGVGVGEFLKGYTGCCYKGGNCLAPGVGTFTRIPLPSITPSPFPPVVCTGSDWFEIPGNSFHFLERKRDCFPAITNPHPKTQSPVVYISFPQLHRT